MPVICNTADAPAFLRYAFEGDWKARDFLQCRREQLQAGQLTRKTAVSFLVTTEEQHNCARQLQALLGPQSVINEIFRDETTAFEWLSQMAGRAHSIRA